jgi:putative tricarboxylic transport membrane protein
MSGGPIEGEDTSPVLVDNRTMDIVVALLFVALASVFMYGCWKIGVGWLEEQGPASGFFPFYISLFMALASLLNLQRAIVRAEPDGDEPFVTRTMLLRVLYVLLPTALYVVGIQYLGIYVSSAVFIAAFMLISRESVWKALLVGISTSLALFMMFEKWFLVPLPKGPIEAMLGF